MAPRELEEAALGVPGVRLAAAVGLPDRAHLTETAVVAVEDERAHSSEAGPLAAEIARAVTHAAGFAPGEVVVVPPRSIPFDRQRQGPPRAPAGAAAPGSLPELTPLATV